jgi:hypothetical protein
MLLILVYFYVKMSAIFYKILPGRTKIELELEVKVLQLCAINYPHIVTYAILIFSVIVLLND